MPPTKTANVVSTIGIAAILVLMFRNNRPLRAPEAMRITKSLIKGKPDAVRGRIYEEASLFGERLRSTEARDAFMAFMKSAGEFGLTPAARSKLKVDDGGLVDEFFGY